MQLPVSDREIKLPDYPVPDLDYQKAVVVHPGKHWPSKTFPEWWWRDVCNEILARGLTPVVVGKTVDDNVGFVNFDATGCVDLRDKISLRDFIAIAKATHCVISNDSAIIHAAAAGDAFIGVIATCKHPDYISHWRRGQWQWRFKNLSLGGLYDPLLVSPFIDSDLKVDDIDPDFLLRCLPRPEDVGTYAANCMRAYDQC